ncbi:MAG: hypothetical protein LBL19_08375 [Spirochaetaceae bacterium]|jgi:hypothetical protein|nr:hypothetical protein [Spirochaetaceae bacterium]
MAVSKKAFLGWFGSIFLAVFGASPLLGIDLAISGGLGNMAFDAERETTLGSGAEAFEGRLFPLGRLEVSGEAGNGFYYNGGFEREPVLRNRLFINMGIKLDYISLEIGPVIGLFNSEERIVNPGFSAGLGLEFPGILFVNLKASSSLGSVLDITGDYLQKSAEISVGFWVPYVVCSFNLTTRGFALEKGANLLIEDSVTRYFFRADVFSKNVPYTCRLDLGYQNMSRSYSSYQINGTSLDRDSQSDEFKALYIGLETSYTVNPAFKLFLGGELPVYSWSVQPMKSPDKGSFLFRVYTGVVLTLASD